MVQFNSLTITNVSSLLVTVAYKKLVLGSNEFPYSIMNMLGKNKKERALSSFTVFYFQRDMVEGYWDLYLYYRMR